MPGIRRWWLSWSSMGLITTFHWCGRGDGTQRPGDGRSDLAQLVAGTVLAAHGRRCPPLENSGGRWAVVCSGSSRA